ncbi:hypothetical protein [Priestia endophytica]|jgi:hypothetical protein|uniref:Phage protein n=1 Tax=Priestia endophytica TaxID=135735 RepID=A0AAX1Q7P1_9BACI|nr:hypothetical protein [Priestia endophytica]RAS71676.1 hypothetical protein A4R27_25990 [Priestia endophytica]RAS75654.1 hypothetical protein A3864_15305 [Priestia endophytica]RAS82762.1 hypothetical protein A3863_26435 [Priestia endophytica]
MMTRREIEVAILENDRDVTFVDVKGERVHAKSTPEEFDPLEDHSYEIKKDNHTEGVYELEEAIIRLEELKVLKVWKEQNEN